MFTIRLENDDALDFDVRWDQGLLSASDMLSDMILEGLYKSKLQDSVHLQTVLALYDQETVQNNGQTSYLRLKTSVKLHIVQMMRTRNFRVRSEVVEKRSVNKSQKGKKAYVERKVRECFQWQAHGQCSKGNSCSFSHVKLVQGDLYGGQRRKGRSSSLPPHSKEKQTDGEGQKSSKGSGSKQENSFDESEIPCRFKFCKSPSCKFWHPPVCQNYKSEKGCVHGDKCPHQLRRPRLTKGEKTPQKKIRQQRGKLFRQRERNSMPK